MTDQTTPETVADAQPQADAIDQAFNEVKEAELAKPEENPEPVKTEDDNTPWPKKAENALAKEKGKSARFKFQAQQERERTRLLEERIAKLEGSNPKKDGPPSEADFKNYAEFIEAQNDYKINQKFAERDSKVEKSTQEQNFTNWKAERLNAVDKQATEFAKEFPEITQLYSDKAELVKSFPDNIKLALLAADNAPLAFYNLAKEGTLEDLADMSLEDARVEIRLAQRTQPKKLQTNAPKPLPAARGSVAAQKPPEKWTPDDVMKWLNS